MLQSTVWCDRLPLESLVHYDGWEPQATPSAWQEMNDALTAEDCPYPAPAAHHHHPHKSKISTST